MVDDYKARIDALERAVATLMRIVEDAVPEAQALLLERKSTFERYLSGSGETVAIRNPPSAIRAFEILTEPGLPEA